MKGKLCSFPNDFRTCSHLHLLAPYESLHNQSTAKRTITNRSIPILTLLQTIFYTQTFELIFFLISLSIGRRSFPSFT
eukprot:m.80514 g.80514  ORF g.80514 m.80514 type:complete len:78 (+) comp8623_c0_seq4:706-939(+)